MTEFLNRAGTTLARHAHAKTNLTFILSGEYREHLQGRSELCRAGTVRLLPAAQHHENRFVRDSCCLVVEVDAKSLQCMQTDAAIYTRAGRIPSPRVEHLGCRLYAEFRAFDDLSSLVIEGILLEILAEIERYYREGKQEPDWLKTVSQMLHERFADDVSLDEVAAAAGVHPVHLCREFKKRQRMTIGAYLRQLRINKACEMLRNSKISLAEIGLQCGFADQSHFSVVFKRLLRVTPAVFRSASASISSPRQKRP